MNKIAVNNSKKDIDTLNKVVSLFKFIEEINKLKQKVILNIKDHEWHKFIEDIPDDPENIHVFYRDRIGDVEEENETNVLLSVHKPEFERCPQPIPVSKNGSMMAGANIGKMCQLKNLYLLKVKIHFR